MIIRQINFSQIILCLLLLCPMIIFGQSSNIGTFPIYNFNKENHKGSPQNWNIAQDDQGVMYFANNAGLLVFDGIYWQCHKVENQTNVRSVAIQEDGKIFVGAQGEIGYFSPNERGQLIYTSLNPLLEESDHFFADIWEIEIIGQDVYFNTGNSVFRYKEGKITTIFNGNSLSHIAQVNGRLFIYDEEQGLLKLKDSRFQPFYEETTFQNKNVSGIFPFQGDTLLVSTLEHGLFLCTKNNIQEWATDAKETLTQGRIYSGVEIDETTFAFGTSTKGVLIINKKGQVLRHINQKIGLQINNVLSLFVDDLKNIWVGLDNGIDYIEVSSPFTYIYPDEGLKAMSYAVQIHNNQIYFGTSNGLYRQPWRSYYNPLVKMPYQLVKNAEGQVWNLSVFGEDLLLNHHKGSFSVKQDLAVPIFTKSGTWMQLPVGEGKLLTGYYDGLMLLGKNPDSYCGWKITHNFFYNWRESCRVMAQDDRGYIWISHPYRGVFKVQFNEAFSEITRINDYNSKDGFPSDLNIYVFKIGEEIVFCTERGIYAYNETKNRFEPNEKWNAVFGANTWVKRLIEAPNGDIWYVTADEVGVLEVKDGGIYKDIKKRIFPQLKDRLVDNFEHIYPYNEENIFIASEDCFIHYNPQQTPTDTSFNMLIRSVQLTKNDSIIYHGNIEPYKKKPIISYQQNAVQFGFSATYFANIGNNQFQYYLDGLDDTWSSWTTKTEIGYTNLKAGTYTFRVKGKNINGIVSEEATFSFKIASPWYATNIAFVIYFILLGGLFFSLIFIPKKQFEREKVALQLEQEEILLRKEKEIQVAEKEHQQLVSQLEKEKLELQIQGKNQELASNTMHLVQKSEILQKLKNDIQKITKLSQEPLVIKELKKIIRKVSADEHLDNDWEQFAQHFDRVHGQFLQRLRTKYPQLTPKDHRLCAYLRMNLSSKEIAPLMNISVRSVEVARYRLRKKLEIDGDVNLVGFMLEV